MKTMIIKIDAELANTYHNQYLKAFGEERTRRMTLDEFLRSFVEDRLREELEFVEEQSA